MVSTKTVFATFALLVSSVLADVCVDCTSSPNNCDITAPCASAFGQRLLCGCRPGYRATGVDPADTTKQWRFDIPYHEYRIWVAPGVQCNTLCNWPYGGAACDEVPFTDQCVAYPPPQPSS